MWYGKAMGIWPGYFRFDGARGGWQRTHTPASLAPHPRDPDRPTVPQVMPLVWIYRCMPGHSVGGSLHITLDDANIDDRSLAFCRVCAARDGDTCGVALACVLESLSMTQRKKVAARSYDGTVWESPQNPAPVDHPRYFIEGRATADDFWDAFHGQAPG